MAAGSAGEGAGSNTELRWTFSRLACQSELELAKGHNAQGGLGLSGHTVHIALGPL